MINSYMKFTQYVFLRENADNLEQPHIISADPHMKLPEGIKRLAEAFRKSKEVPLGKEVDPKGGEKDVTMKSRKLFIVGGAVRDHLLGRTPRNYDMVTDAHPDEIVKICAHCKPPIFVKEKKNGFVKITVDGETYKIETMRQGDDENGSPIFTNDIKKDAERRDMTINALYYDISGNKIIDYHGGLRHLKDGSVKFIGDAGEKIQKDPVTAFKYARMQNIIPNAKDDGSFKELISKHMNSGDDMPMDKIRDEFWKGLENLHSNVQKYIKFYHENGLLEKVFPGLDLNFDFPQCKTCKSRPIVLASLLKNNNSRMLSEKLKKMEFPDREIRETIFLINLLDYVPEKFETFKTQLIRTGLSSRQILDWARANHLDVDEITKLCNKEQVQQPDKFMKLMKLV